MLTIVLLHTLVIAHNCMPNLNIESNLAPPPPDPLVRQSSHRSCCKPDAGRLTKMPCTPLAHQAPCQCQCCMTTCVRVYARHFQCHTSIQQPSCSSAQGLTCIPLSSACPARQATSSLLGGQSGRSTTETDQTHSKSTGRTGTTGGGSSDDPLQAFLAMSAASTPQDSRWP